ncbi:hypothetical protein Btru_048236 [Bulinus truncatus]|nr:hypothetical protein Btru_048236 [Bulinus truncatus]
MDTTPAASASASERPTSGVERNSAITYKNAVKDAIHETFLEYVDVDIILNIFKKYNRRVLVQKELEFIKSKLKNEGNRNACEELLNRLVKYDEWFPCLLKCLRDKYVNLGHVADQLVELEVGRGAFPVKKSRFKATPPMVKMVRTHSMVKMSQNPSLNGQMSQNSLNGPNESEPSSMVEMSQNPHSMDGMSPEPRSMVRMSQNSLNGQNESEPTQWLK